MGKTEQKLGFNLSSHPRYNRPMSMHAVVISGSVAGLSAAQALTRIYTRVTLIERNTLPDCAEQRAGTPQALHIHVLLTRGVEGAPV